MRKNFSCAVMAAVLSLGVYSPSANAAVRIDIENTAIPQERAARPNYSGISLSVPEFGKFIGGESDDIFPHLFPWQTLCFCHKAPSFHFCIYQYAICP